MRSIYMLACTLLLSSSTNGQVDRLYHINPGKVKVFNANGTERELAWAGGLNNPQFGMADLNNDGIGDLLVYEPGGNIRTFIKTGNAGTVKYRYEPKYEKNLPNIVQYFKIVDYNGDKVADLITGTNPMRRYKGSYNAAKELVFSQFDEITYTFRGKRENMSIINTSYMPEIADLDNDGNPDILTFDYLLSPTVSVFHFKNMRTSTMPADTVYYKWVDKCWAKFEQQDARKTHTLGIECNAENSLLKPDGGSANKATGGGHGIIVFDADGDGDMDMLSGNTTRPEVQLLKNGRVEFGYPRDTMILQDSTWPSNGKPVMLDHFPMGYWLDIDADGDKDILFSPFAASTENYRCVHYYRNSGSDASPNFVFATDTLFMDDLIDLGENAYPALYDYNRDGKPDLFVGSKGYYKSGNGLRQGKLHYYSNTSTPGSPSLKSETYDFNNLSALGLSGAAPAFGDLNADTKDDMIIGKNDGTLIFFQNASASNSDVPNWTLKPGNIQADGKDIKVGSGAMPLIYDMDGDGSKDLIIGNTFAEIEFYKNLGADATGYPKLTLITDKLGDVHVAGPLQVNGNSCPFVGKVDNTNNEYLLVGNDNGVIYKYSFIRSNLSTPFQLIDTFYSQIKGFGTAAPVVGDLDGNGKYEMFLGTKYGGILLYEQLFDVKVDPVDAVRNKITIYPNPAQQEIILSIDGKALQADAIIRVYDGTGRMVQPQQNKLDDRHIKLDISALPAGLYICSLVNGSVSSTGSFIKK
ncbi:MAG: T9SS type A sorting domain-containing protein [Sphingobacteriales bacterium]|nr:MAG: T9SS type A sorting domain-containing protein [Sphingobacteriales bacterium]